MTLNRQYIPAIGKSVKLRNYSDYSQRRINVWAWLRVHSFNSDGVTVQVLNGDQPTGQILNVPLSVISPPIGWESTYTIYCKPGQAQIVVDDWFKRGILVRANHDLGSGIGSAFQPMDNSAAPHWRYPEATDAISAEDCPRIFRVVAVEQEEINHYSNPEHPNFREMGRSKRAKAIKEMEAQGWKVEYVRYAYGYWTRTRETVIHEICLGGETGILGIQDGAR